MNFAPTEPLTLWERSLLREKQSIREMNFAPTEPLPLWERSVLRENRAFAK